MRLCAFSDRPPEYALPQPGSDCVIQLALPWSAVAEYVSPADLDGNSLRDKLDRIHHRLVCVILPPLTCQNAQSFEQQTDDAYMQMQIAQRLEAHAVVIFSAHDEPGDMECLTDAVGRLAALAERMPLTLLLRNQRSTALEQPEAMAAILRAADSPALGVCLDNLEYHRAAINPADAVLRFANLIQVAWIRDARSGQPCAPGDGMGHVDATLAALAEECPESRVFVEAEHLAATKARFADVLN